MVRIRFPDERSAAMMVPLYRTLLRFLRTDKERVGGVEHFHGAGDADAPHTPLSAEVRAEPSEGLRDDPVDHPGAGHRDQKAKGSDAR
jgi:hypothetical protein